ncbi:hypothetical protein BT93_F3420 [Corymbia citriodora subsp. variegata]|nr:hypothetical protein BT93_F3420 [Corymbia citriodora subsp. variegata]
MPFWPFSSTCEVIFLLLTHGILNTLISGSGRLDRPVTCTQEGRSQNLGRRRRPATQPNTIQNKFKAKPQASASYDSAKFFITKRSRSSDRSPNETPDLLAFRNQQLLYHLARFLAICLKLTGKGKNRLNQLDPHPPPPFPFDASPRQRPGSGIAPVLPNPNPPIPTLRIEGPFPFLSFQIRGRGAGASAFGAKGSALPSPNHSGTTNAAKGSSPPSDRRWHKNRSRSPLPRHEDKINAGKKLGLLFIGVASILQIFVVGFLVFKRRQLMKTKDRYEMCP